MTGRDRIVLIAVIVFAVLGVAWMFVVSPERKQASKLNAQVVEAQAQLSSAEGQLASARTAESQYSKAYASVVSLGKAVPPSQEVPSLIYQLEHASNQKSVDFSSIVSGAGTGASATPSTPAAAGTASASSAAPAAFTQMPFTFIFSGSFFDLDHLVHQLDGFTQRTSSGALLVSGRLLTIQSVKLSPVTNVEGKAGELTGTITATAYVLPSSQGLTGSAAPATGSTPAAATTTAPASSSPTAPAIVKVNP